MLHYMVMYVFQGSEFRCILIVPVHDFAFKFVLWIAGLKVIILLQ